MNGTSRFSPLLAMPGPPASNRLPDCPVVSHRERRLDFRRDLVAGERVIISFIYSRCEGVCPMATERLRAVHARLAAAGGEPFRFISLSIDPARDTPDDLHRYAARFGVADIEGWEFVVGTPSATLALQRVLGALDPAEPGGTTDPRSHSGMLMMGNDRTNRWGGIAAGCEPAHIAAAFQRLTRPGSLRAMLEAG